MKTRVSNERKNLNRLAGEFLVASRLTQRGHMVTLQWGTTIGYDILAFDKAGHVAFIEVKTAAQTSKRWILQAKYATPENDRIPLERRFVCCVDMADGNPNPDVYVFPAKVVAEGMHYFFGGRFPNSTSYHLSLDFKPQGRTKEEGIQTVGDRIDAASYLDAWHLLGIEPVVG
ncbi:protein NO VEIN domain-containing protein [Sulfuritalea hydrogenivorans]|uniref:Protein NO VEIN C-terminal domain-containing protein n=1 Tax=Sulfuritalea hydrogenivorans sk43H TaxID=1223802 RepID=W0SE42_9PROT|nr:DUF3883 domain-containing protein [Sulfuritalea hydrogenivorans]BAO29489.1 hypothetical protein SUTH_01696 [Sulfuritalea hydrogenivorans sk43H]